MPDSFELDSQTFAQVVKHAPLIAIDLLLQDAQGRILLGFRRNQPAKGKWFVPGGRIRKNERLEQALRRIVCDELGVESFSEEAAFAGVFEHFHEENFASEAGFGTHYVVLAYKFALEPDLTSLPPGQHSKFRWWHIAELIGSPDVHPYTKNYFLQR